MIARNFFDYLIEKYGEAFEYYLSSYADVIVDYNFDNELIKVLNNNENQLT